MKKQNITTFEEAVNYLYEVPRFTRKNTLEDTKAYLHRLGDPDQKMRIIHVAGTNGKGSVCAYLRYILEAAGYRVAAFTSPHLVDVRERFLIGGKMVEKQTFLDAFLQIYNSLDWEALEVAYGSNGVDYFMARLRANAFSNLTNRNVTHNSDIFTDPRDLPQTLRTLIILRSAANIPDAVRDNYAALVQDLQAIDPTAFSEAREMLSDSERDFARILTE